MVSHRSLSDSKSPRVSRTFLSILADLNNTVVGMISARRLFQVLQFLYHSFGDRTESANYNWYQRHFHVPVFSVLKQGLGMNLSFRFFSVLLCGQPGRPSLLFGRFVFWLTITRSSRLAVIRWSVCISKS